MNTLDQAVANMIRNLEEKTGKSFADWTKLARATKIAKHRELLNHLKAEHGLTYGYANVIALKALETEAEAAATEDDLVAAQYAGAKSELKPVYDALIAAVSQFGDDVEVAPKKAYVSLRRKKQFAILQPSTATRLDVGLNLKGVPTTDRLEASGSFNSMVSHRVKLSSKKEVDQELIGWLRQAYGAA
jgi:predicted transport protein